VANLPAILAFVVLAALSGFHLYWAFGGQAGMRSVIPEGPNGAPLFRPGKAATLIVAALLLAAGGLLLIHRGLLPLGLSVAWTRWGCLLCGAVFFARSIGEFKYVGFFKRVRGTVFAMNDTRLFSPLCLILAAAFAISALSPR